MRLYQQVYAGTQIRYRRDRLIDCALTGLTTSSVKERYNTDIDRHINQKAGLIQDSRLCDSYGLVALKNRPNTYVRMYGATK